MNNQPIDPNASSPHVAVPTPTQDLPHGLLTLPEQVRKLIEQERATFPVEAFAKAEERLLNEWTMGFYFDGLCQEVLYHPTPQGPEVVAVGCAEVLALKMSAPPEVQRQLKTYLGYL